MKASSKIVQSIKKPVFLVSSLLVMITPAWITSWFFTGYNGPDACVLVTVVALTWALIRMFSEPITDLLNRTDHCITYEWSEYTDFLVSMIGVPIALLIGLTSIHPVDFGAILPIQIIAILCLLLTQFLIGRFFFKLNWKGMITILWFDVMVAGVFLYHSSPIVGALVIAGIIMIVAYVSEGGSIFALYLEDKRFALITSILGTIIPLGVMISNLRNMEIWGSVVLWHVLVGIVVFIVTIVLLLVGFAFFAGLWEKRQEKKKRQAIAEAEAEKKAKEKAEDEARRLSQEKERQRIRDSWKEFLTSNPEAFDSLGNAARFSRFIASSDGKDFANRYLTMRFSFRLNSGMETSGLKKQIIYSNDLCEVIQRIGWVADNVYQDEHLAYLLSLITDLEKDMERAKEYKGYPELTSLIKRHCSTLLALREKVSE